MTVQNKGGSWAINALSRVLKMNLNTKKDKYLLKVKM